MARTGRPELGELTVGQDVIVVRSSNDSRRQSPEDRYIPARIVKVARVWIEMQRADLETWRMRRDTQDEGTQYSGNNASFLTLKQHAWEETRAWARGVLAEQGIRLDSNSPWRDREARLADLITKGEES